MVVGSLAVGCATNSSDSSDDTRSTSSKASTEEFVAEVDDFVNLAAMTPVRGFFISHPGGKLDEAVAVAESADGGTYPVGTIIQLIPQEAMVKRGGGFDPAANDWEFFELDVSAAGTEIHQRGRGEIESRFGVGSCSSCHSQAGDQFDLVCEDTHGCEPLPVSDDIILGLQEGDPRPPL